MAKSKTTKCVFKHCENTAAQELLNVKIVFCNGHLSVLTNEDQQRSGKWRQSTQDILDNRDALKAYSVSETTVLRTVLA